MTDKPSKFGCKWTSDEKEYLYNNIKKEQMDDVIIDIANKLSRTEGGVRCELRKKIIELYLTGEDDESISDNYNIELLFVRKIIKMYLEKNAENDLIILERENKLLKLRLENAKLQNELKREIHIMNNT